MLKVHDSGGRVLGVRAAMTGMCHLLAVPRISGYLTSKNRQATLGGAGIIGNGQRLEGTLSHAS